MFTINRYDSKWFKKRIVRTKLSKMGFDDCAYDLVTRQKLKLFGILAACNIVVSLRMSTKTSRSVVTMLQNDFNFKIKN